MRELKNDVKRQIDFTRENTSKLSSDNKDGDVLSQRKLAEKYFVL